MLFPDLQSTGNDAWRKKSLRNRKSGLLAGFGILTLFSFDLREETPVVWKDTSAEMRFISDESVFRGESINNGHLFKERLQKGDMCCCVIVRGKAVSYCWMAQDSAYIGEISKKIILKNDEIYLFDGFTKPEYRGKGFFTKTLSFILCYGREKGYQRALIFALSSNKSSIAAIKKTGFDKFQRVCFIDIGNRIICRSGKARKDQVGIEKQLENMETTRRKGS